MDWKEILITVVSIIATGLAGWLTTMVTSWISTKIKDKKLAEHATAVWTIVSNAVQAVFQSFVEVLKEKGEFNEEKQKEAKQKAVDIIKAQLSDELRKYIVDNFGDLEEFINMKIEAVIYELKR